MSYDISFRVRVYDTELYIPVWQSGNISWNVRDIIVKFTGLEWKNEDNNGFCTDVIPKIRQGHEKLRAVIQEYDDSKSPYSLGRLIHVDNFFLGILDDWRRFGFDYPDLISHVTFWIT